MLRVYKQRKRAARANARHQNGLTLVELLVTTGILLMVASITLAGYPEFAQRLSLKRAAQEVALIYRRAQSFALAVREFQTQFPGYGVAVNLADSRQTLVLFADFSLGGEDFVGNLRYDGEESGEKVEEFRLQSNITIARLCTNKQEDGSWENCAHQTLEVVYTRPDPIITLRADAETANISNVGVTLATLRGVERTIVIWGTGQITIE
jgi:prepilin-type N-terminal cleavage/methylation domain-containing protein